MTQNTLKTAFDYIDGKLIWKNIDQHCRVRKNGDAAGSLHHTNRFTIRFNKKQNLRSRLVWIYHNGDIPTGMQVDHINRNTLDDRIENLRLVTPKQNARNRIVKNKTNHCGIYYIKQTNKYVARIYYKNKRIYIGSYHTAKEAENAYILTCNDLFQKHSPFI